MDKIKEAARTIMDSNYEIIGIRHITPDESYKVGDIARNSYDWDYENDLSSFQTSPVELDGTCAYSTDIDINFDDENEIEEKLITALEASRIYSGTVVILGGNDYEYGNDDNEVIIEDAEVLYIF